MSNLIGNTLGPYRIIEQIGLGGMATVYKAYQPSMDRYVALKVLSTHLSQTPTFVKRFQQEAKVIAKLEHLHILPVYDHGEENDYLYLVMRFIEAGTLKDRLSRGGLSLEETRRVVNQVGSALAYAHQLGVIHRDLKPSNILIDRQGDCYLTDFGIAKMVEGSLNLTGSNVIGTPQYMAPEQGETVKVDERADIYAMGVVIYEMVTGRLPFDAETPFAVVMKHLTEPLPLPRSLRPDLPEEVERVILRALAKHPADRYQTMSDLVAAFDQAVQTASAEVRTATSPGPVAYRGTEPVSTATLSPGSSWLAAQPPWLLGAAALGLIVLVVAGLILSQVPGRVEISGGQVQVILPSDTPSPAASPLPTATEAAVIIPPTVTATPTATTPTATPTKEMATATPTPHPARAFAEPILATIANRPPDLHDDFSDPASGWESGAITDQSGWEEGKRGYADGEYSITVPPAKLRPQKPDMAMTCAGSHPINQQPFSDMVLEVEGRFVQIGDGNWSINFRQWHDPASGAEGKYHVMFESHANVRIDKRLFTASATGREGQERHWNLAEIQGMPIRAGFEPNRLQIVAAGPQIAVYVNGEPALFGIDPDFDERFGSGLFDLVICNLGDTPMEARWDNLKIWDISKLSLPETSQVEQARAFAEPILAAIADRPPDFADDFSPGDKSWRMNFGLQGAHTGQFEIAGGVVRMALTENSDALLSREETFKNFALALDLRHVSGSRDSGQQIFLSLPDGGWIVLDLNGDGFWSVGKRYGNQEPVLLESGKINTTMGETISLLLIVNKDELATYFNDAPVVYLKDKDLDMSRQVWFMCRGAPDIECEFDNIKVWDLANVALTPDANTYILTDHTWKFSPNLTADWTQLTYDDSGWATPDSRLCQDLWGLNAACLWEKPYLYIPNRALYFRQVFNLVGVPPRARVLTLVDDNVDLYVNGELALQDDAAGISWWETDVTGLLQPGSNVLALRGVDTGEGTASVQAVLGLCNETEDKYQPIVEIMNHWEDWFDGQIYLEAVDAPCDSGVVEVAYRVDGGAWQTVERHKILQLPPGEYDVEARALDGAGRQGFDKWHFLVGQPPATPAPTNLNAPKPRR